jgi:hypothetical protein
MSNIYDNQKNVSTHFKEIYKKDDSFDNMPWITGAVDIDLLKKIINKSF